MTEKTANICETFRLKREELNVSLREAETATSIRMSYLQAIENGNLNQLIPSVYAEGFVKQYARFLGMDGETIIREHPELLGKVGKQHFDYGIGTLEVRDNPGAGVKWLPNAVWIGAFFLLLLSAWYLATVLGVI